MALAEALLADFDVAKLRRHDIPNRYVELRKADAKGRGKS